MARRPDLQDDGVGPEQELTRGSHRFVHRRGLHGLHHRDAERLQHVAGLDWIEPDAAFRQGGPDRRPDRFDGVSLVKGGLGRRREQRRLRFSVSGQVAEQP